MSERETEKVESMEVDSLIWSEPEEASRQENSFQIYAVSKGLKNPKILENIKPDYGSLGEFMKNVAISKDILLHNRKKKNEQQDDLEQKKIRSMLRNQNLDKVLKHEDSTPLEKTIASKMIIENIFQNKFGTGLQSFCTLNSKLQNFNHSHSSVSDLANLLDNMMVESRKDMLVSFDVKNQAPVLSRKNQMYSSQSIEILSLAEKVEKLTKLASNYPSLKKVNIVFPVLEESRFSPLEKGVLAFSRTQLSFSTLTPLILRVEMESIRCLKLCNVQISQDILALILDYFTDDHCTQLRELVIQKCQFSNTERVSDRIKTFIQDSKVQKVELTGLGLTSKDFCLITLGIGARSSFEYLGLRDNNIGQITKKCLDVLMKFHKETKFNFTGNPIQRQIKGRPGYSRCFT